MIIPIGHEEHTVRRLPWVTFAIIALNIVAFLTIGLSAERTEKRVGECHSRVVEYWSAHPYLDLPEDFLSETTTPRERRDVTLISEAMKGAGHTEEEMAERAAQQQELERLVAAFWEAREAHPYWSWGLVPRDPSITSFLTSMFMHAGWLHLLTNMFIFFLAGPPIEDRYGRLLFAGLYVASGLVASVSQVAAAPHSAIPLVGASGAIAGIMGIFLVRLARTRIRFFYWFAFVFHGTFSAPAWTMLSLWLLQQLFYGSLVSADGGVAYWAHAGGFVFGIGAALAIRQLQVEERLVHPAIESKVSVEQHPKLEEGMALLVRGELEGARACLLQVVADEPTNTDARLGLWQSFLVEERVDEGAEHLSTAIEAEVRSGEVVLALDHWMELAEYYERPGSPALRYRLASLAQDVDPEAAARLFRSLIADPEAGLLEEKASRRLEDMGEPLALEDAETGVGTPGDMMGGSEEHPEQAAAPVSEPARTEIEVVVPEVLKPDGLLIHAMDGDLDFVGFGTIEAFAVGGIAGDGGRPVLVIDVVHRASASQPPRILRMLSSSFDPRKVIGDPEIAPMSAVRELLGSMIKSTGARVLAGRELVDGGRPQIFGTQEEFDRAVYPELFESAEGDGEAP